jgi:flagellar biosynthesis/type III secretory pathway M-ring protein FliF/YscJ
MNTTLYVVIALVVCIVLVFIVRKAAAIDRARKEARLQDLDDAPFGEVTNSAQKLHEMSEKYKNDRGLDRVNRFGGGKS